MLLEADLKPQYIEIDGMMRSMQLSETVVTVCANCLEGMRGTFYFLILQPSFPPISSNPTSVVQLSPTHYYMPVRSFSD